MNATSRPRRHLPKAAGPGATRALAGLGSTARAQASGFGPNERRPDPAVQILDPSFAKHRIGSGTLPYALRVDAHGAA